MDFILVIFSLIILLFSVIIHELAHGYVALSLGDPTAKYAGRLTLNPIKHLDWFGSVILPILMLILTAGQGPILGWAKPVPINPYNFKDQKWGSVKVAVVGPLSNISIAIVFGLMLRIMPVALMTAMPGIVLMFTFIIQINIILALFNLIPIPPLDGHWVLFHFIPDRFMQAKLWLQRYGIFILLFLLFFGFLGWLSGVVQIVFHLITGI